jgi:hypothetical protein
LVPVPTMVLIALRSHSNLRSSRTLSCILTPILRYSLTPSWLLLLLLLLLLMSLLLLLLRSLLLLLLLSLLLLLLLLQPILLLQVLLLSRIMLLVLLLQVLLVTLQDLLLLQVLLLIKHVLLPVQPSLSQLDRLRLQVLLPRNLIVEHGLQASRIPPRSNKGLNAALGSPCT